MEENKQEDGFSVLRVLKVVFRRPWLFAGIALLLAVALFLGIRFGVNPVSSEYYIRFSLEFPGIETRRYPDGTAFRYQDMVGLANLDAVKGADGAFLSLNVSDMYEESDITLTAETTTSEEGETEYTGYYTLRVKASYFRNADAARSFLRAVARTPIEYVNRVSTASDWGFYLSQYAQADTYSERIDLLAAQRDYLSGKYDELIATYGENYSVNGKTLLSYRADVNAVMSKNQQLLFSSELQANGYLYDEIAARLQLQSLTYELQTNLEMLELLPDGSLSETVGEKALELIERNAEIEREMAALDPDGDGEILYDAEASAAFGARMDDVCSRFADVTDVYTDVYGSILRTESAVLFDSNRVQTDGGIGTVLSLLLSVAGGVVLSFGVVLLLYWKRDRAAADAPSDPDQKTE